jgi:hypothetical protein
MSLVLRKARGNRPGPPEWERRRFRMWLSGGQVVGRIYRRSGVPDDRDPWFWGILAVTPSGMTMNGIAPTLEAAKQAFAEAWWEARREPERGKRWKEETRS